MGAKDTGKGKTIFKVFDEELPDYARVCITVSIENPWLLKKSLKSPTNSRPREDGITIWATEGSEKCEIVLGKKLLEELITKNWKHLEEGKSIKSSHPLTVENPLTQVQPQTSTISPKNSKKEFLSRRKHSTSITSRINRETSSLNQQESSVTSPVREHIKNIKRSIKGIPFIVKKTNS